MVTLRLAASGRYLWGFVAGSLGSIWFLIILIEPHHHDIAEGSQNFYPRR